MAHVAGRTVSLIVLVAMIASCSSPAPATSVASSTPGLTPTPTGAATSVAGDVLIGTWEATDVDGSAMTLTIEPGAEGLAVTLDDEFAAFCARPGAPRIGYLASGVAIHEGDELRVDVNAEHCGMLDIHSDELRRTDEMSLTYDASRDELNGLDVTWVRR